MVLAVVLSSCGQESQDRAAPLGERAENDVPLNPPTLRFHVSADGQADATVSASAGDGKTGTAINLAVAAAGDGASVAILDFDLRKPEIAASLGSDAGHGLGEVGELAVGIE